MNFLNDHNLSQEHLEGLKVWFSQYIRPFYSGNPLIQQPLKLKEEHSQRVCDAILDIGKKLVLSEKDLRIAEAIALFHDIGRFEQITRYRTFVDRKSENHAELGVKVLKKEKVLSALDDGTRSLILKAISNHNRLTIKGDESPVCIFYSQLLRDADKLDIFELFSHYYYGSPEERNSAVELDLPDLPDVSEEVLTTLQQDNVVGNQQLKSLNDFKMLQMAWVYDINFQPTFQIVREKHYLKKLRDTLPASERIDQIYLRMILYIEKKTGDL
jgi:hypothetical protein